MSNSRRQEGERPRAELTNGPNLHQALGAVMGGLGRYSEAEKLLRRALEINPLDPMARVNLGNIHIIRGDLGGC